MRKEQGQKAKRLLAAAAVLPALLLSACGGKGAEEEIVTFTIMYSGNYNPDYKCLAKMTELTNVSLEIEAFQDNGYDARSLLTISTGENMPDLIAKTKPTSAQALSGALLPVSDYYDQMPHFMEFIEKNNLQYLIENARQSDGKVYELPVNTKEVRTSSKQIFIRKDIFEKNDIPVPVTYEDLYTAAKRLKELYPDSWPIQVYYGNGNLLDIMAPSFGTSGGWGAGIDNFHYVEERDEWIFAPVSEEYKELLQYLNRLYAEELLNPEYITYSMDTYTQMAYEGRTFVLMAEWLGFEKTYTDFLQESGDADAEWIPIYPLEGPAGAYLGRMSHSTQTMVIAASSAKKDSFPRLLAWLDWMYTDEGADLFSWGIEGETYTVEADGTKVLNPNVKCAANPDGTWDISAEYGTSNNCLSFVYPYDHEMAVIDSKYMELLEKETAGHAIPNLEPSLALTQEDIEIQSHYNMNLNNYVDRMTTKFIMGGASFEEWDTYVAECEKKGMNVLKELYNEVWKRR